VKCKAVITTKWDTKTYRPFTVENVESYFADTALDNDSDAFQLEIGDPEHKMIETLSRDNEVRVQVFGVAWGANLLFTGLADSVTFDETGVLTINGRDMSSLAVDSMMKPQLWQSIKASDLIPKQARDLGMTGPFHITEKSVVKKLQFTDASESYWDFWYRLVRKDQMWIWTEPDGSLWTGYLNYNTDTTKFQYFFGDPPKSASTSVAEKYHQIQTLEFRSGKQGRVAEVWVYGHRGDNGLTPVVARDEDIQDWIRKPKKILLDTDAHNANAQAKMAREEIFESKVGALEIRITIKDPGHAIHQNNMAHINLPAMGITGDFFIVGSRVQASNSGFLQEIRLREPRYAITKRVPADPKVADQPGTKQTSDIGKQLGYNYSQFFTAAAKRWHGGWDFSLYLATLLAMCEKEGSFGNHRENGGPGGSGVEWYQWKATGTKLGDATSEHSAPGSTVDSHNRTKSEWEEVFANEAGDGYVGREYGVGPMQLTTRSYKTEADDLLKLGFRNEFSGGRWHPEHNIMVAAHVLRQKLQATTRDSFRDIDIWLGVAAYNGSGPAADAYAQAVKSAVYSTYLPAVKDAQKAAQDAAKTADPPATSPQDPQDPDFGPLGKNFNYSKNLGGGPHAGTHNTGKNWQSDNAVDIFCPYGTPVYAVNSGNVGNWGVLPSSGHQVQENPNPRTSDGDVMAGNRINIIGPRQSSYYAHMNRLNPAVCKNGIFIKAGTLLGWSGHANGALHLHFAVESGSPYSYIPGGQG